MGATVNAAPRGLLDHPALGTVAYRTDAVSADPDTQVAQTIALMRQYVIEDLRDPYLLMDAVAASYPDPINGTWRLVCDRLTFAQDETTAESVPLSGDQEAVEVLVRPADVARGAPVGDCDDFAMFTCALLEAQGIPTSFCTVAAEADEPRRFSHVYAVAYLGGQRIPMDTSHGEYPGWETERAYRKQEWPLHETASVAPALLTGIAAWWLLRAFGGLL